MTTAETPKKSAGEKLVWDDHTRLKLLSVVLATATGIPTTSQLADVIGEEGWTKASLSQQLWKMKNEGRKNIKHPIEGLGGDVKTECSGDPAEPITPTAPKKKPGRPKKEPGAPKTPRTPKRKRGHEAEEESEGSVKREKTDSSE